MLSWSKLIPKPEILIFGNEHGIKEMSSEISAVNITDIARNSSGTPLWNEIFNTAQRKTSNDIIVYINSDIILMNAFVDMIREISFEKFLIVGERIDIELRKSIDFTIEWEKSILEVTEKNGIRHGPTGIDYFIFRKGQYLNLPPFVLGRPFYDNWIIWKTLKMKIPVIKGIDVIHQNHHYNHSGGAKVTWCGDEAKNNLRMAGGWNHLCNLLDASYLYLNGQIVLNKSLISKKRKIKRRIKEVIYQILSEQFRCRM
jgi:hypothetical protein